MHYAYILQSLKDPSHFYTGYTSNLKRCFQEHDSGKSIYANKFKPWKIRTYAAFETLEQAQKFEKFLKSGNGRIFAKFFFNEIWNWMAPGTVSITIQP